jgi:ribosomal protein L28
MLNITDTNKMEQITADALRSVNSSGADAQTKRRWINAICKASLQIENHGVFMTWQPETNSLLIWSQDSDGIYSSNGVCQCKSFTEFNQACWHRAAARMVRLYMEPQAAPVEVKEIPYLKPTIERKAERVAGIRIN